MSRDQVKTKADTNMNFQGKLHVVLCNLVENVVEKPIFLNTVCTQAFHCLKKGLNGLNQITF